MTKWVEKEVNGCFREDPTLVNKSFREMAVYFFLQGENRHRELRDALQSKVAHYRKALRRIDSELLDQTDAMWEDN